MRLPVVNERGECLRRVVEGPQAVEALAGTGTTIDFALVLVRQGTRVLLVRNRRRSLWELPGGLLDPGESPERAAARELAEETGQTAPRLDLLALLELTLVGNAFTHLRPGEVCCTGQGSNGPLPSRPARRSRRWDAGPRTRYRPTLRRSMRRCSSTSQVRRRPVTRSRPVRETLAAIGFRE